MKKVLLAGLIGAGVFGASANAAGFLSNLGDAVTGRNQHYNVSENELMGAEWYRLSDTTEETVFYRVKDIEAGCQDGLWLKYVSKQGEGDEYKHYQTDCSGKHAVTRNAKVEVKKDGSLERKKQDKAVKDPDEADQIRNAICRGDVPRPKAKPVAKPAVSGNGSIDITLAGGKHKVVSNCKKLIVVPGEGAICFTGNKGTELHASYVADTDTKSVGVKCWANTANGRGSWNCQQQMDGVKSIKVNKTSESMVTNEFSAYHFSEGD